MNRINVHLKYVKHTITIISEMNKGIYANYNVVKLKENEGAVTDLVLHLTNGLWPAFD